MDRKILIWIGRKQRRMYSKELIKILLKELAIKSAYAYGYYAKKFSCVFENIDEIETIQVYQDGVIRIIFLYVYGKKRKSIFIEKYDAEELRAALEKIFE